MPSNVVKNKADEKKWKKAKAAAADGGEPRWPLVMHIFKRMSKAEDEDKNVKIERALAAQGKKSTIPAEAHEALHAWWQSNKATALTPEQHQKLAEVKAVKQKRSGFKVVKSAKKIQDLLGKIRDASERLKKDDGKKRRSSARDWEPHPEHSPEELVAIDRLVEQGYHPREAAHLISNGRGGRGEPRDFQGALKSSVRPTMLSDKMLEHAKDVARQWLENNSRYSAKNLDAEKNPVKVASAQAKTAYEEANRDYHKAYHDFLNSEDLKSLKGLARHKAVQAWDAKYKKENPQYEQGLQSASEVGKNYKEAEEARTKHVEDVKAHLAAGGAYAPTETGNDEDLGGASSREVAQHLGVESGEDDASSASIHKDPTAAFASQNRDFIEQHISPSVQKPASTPTPTQTPASTQAPAPETPKEDFKPKMVVRRMAKPEQLERLKNIDAVKASKKQE